MIGHHLREEERRGRIYRLLTSCVKRAPARAGKQVVPNAIPFLGLRETGRAPVVEIRFRGIGRGKPANWPGPTSLAAACQERPGGSDAGPMVEAKKDCTPKPLLKNLISASGKTAYSFWRESTVFSSRVWFSEVAVTDGPQGQKRGPLAFPFPTEIKESFGQVQGRPKTVRQFPRSLEIKFPGFGARAPTAPRQGTPHPSREKRGFALSPG